HTSSMPCAAFPFSEQFLLPQNCPIEKRCNLRAIADFFGAGILDVSQTEKSASVRERRSFRQHWVMKCCRFLRDLS
ncbi:MAG: hypothetical protein IJK64_07615, partial [Clostridia bacterium]|nr:hypothetical protein [Clostridia bacterium]